MTKPLSKNKVTELCKELGEMTEDTWIPLTYEDYTHDTTYKGVTEGDWYLIAQDYDLAITLDWNDYGNENRYRVSYSKPRVWNTIPNLKGYNHSDTPKSITFSPDRSAYALANDIHKRYFNEWLKFNYRCAENVIKVMELNDKTDNLVKLFKSIGVHVSRWNDSTEFSFSHYYTDKISLRGKVALYSTGSESYTMEFKLDNLKDVVNILEAFQNSIGGE